MDLRGKKLGLLVSCGPEAANFTHAMGLAEAALRRGAGVYLYCLDDAVTGLQDERLQALRRGGARVFACALAAQRRQIAYDDSAAFSGLGMVHEIMAFTDRFLSLN